MAWSVGVITIGLIILIAIISVIYWVIPKTASSRVQGYISMLAAIGIFLGIVSFFLNQQVQAVQNENNTLQQGLSFIQTSLIAVEQYFAANPDLQNMYKGLNLENAELQKLPSVPITEATKYKEIHVAVWLLQIMENINSYVDSKKLKWTSPYLQPWLKLFHSWFQYPVIQQQWEYSRQFSDSSMQKLVDMIR